MAARIDGIVRADTSTSRESICENVAHPKREREHSSPLPIGATAETQKQESEVYICV